MGCRDDQWYRDRAKEEFHDEGTIEVDADSPENCKVSNGGDDGAYVMAWVWVSDEIEDDAFTCPTCGSIDHALVWAPIAAGQRKFQIEIRKGTDGSLVASVSEDDAELLKDQPTWRAEAAKWAATQAVLACPGCGHDVPGPAAEE